MLTAGVAWAYILGQVCAIVTDITEDGVGYSRLAGNQQAN